MRMDCLSFYIEIHGCLSLFPLDTHILSLFRNVYYELIPDAQTPVHLK